MQQARDPAPSIRELQHMLDRLSQRYPQIPRLTETGSFDEATLEAVMVFQRDFDLPVTGVVDQDTWYAIVDAYREDLLRHAPPSPLRVLPQSSYTAGEGAGGEPVRIAQAIFCALSEVTDNFQPCSGDQVNQGATREGLIQVQRLAGLPETGDLDRITWEYLTRLYHVYVLPQASHAAGDPTDSTTPMG